MFSMFGRTGAIQKGPHRPQNVGQQRDIFWPVPTLLKGLLMACRNTLNRSKTARSCKVEFMGMAIFVRILMSENVCGGLHIFTEQGQSGLNSAMSIQVVTTWWHNS